jgi:hypothetical protein
MWVLLRNMYREMTTQVKWDNHLSENIYINQGIQQEDFCYSDSSIICWILHSLCHAYACLCAFLKSRFATISCDFRGYG